MYGDKGVLVSNFTAAAGSGLVETLMAAIVEPPLGGFGVGDVGGFRSS